MASPLKVLIVDDEKPLLDLYTDLLSQLPSKPSIVTASTGARAIALLESESFALMLTDLHMPKMDGFQLLTVVRRKFPALRTAVITGVVDERFRARAYSLGVDLYIEKPTSNSELQIFSSCVESLLDRVEQGGFRGVQHKSLVDLVQMECHSGSSAKLEVTNGESTGRIWILDGEVVDAELQDLDGEEAFAEMMSWRTGGFEIAPAERDRERRIFTTIEGLLLDSAQNQDEQRADKLPKRSGARAGGSLSGSMKKASRISGVEFLCVVDSDDPRNFESWSAENPDELAQWIFGISVQAQSLGVILKAGAPNGMDAFGPQRNLAIRSRGGREIAAGIERNIARDKMPDLIQRIAGKWQP